MSELEVLRVRDEVLQAMYWMRAEGIAEAPSARNLSSFLAVPAATLSAYLDRFVVEGYLELSNGGYELTETGTETGKRSFADEFADMTKPSHGECDENCWCNSSPEAAAECLEEHRGGHHAHQH